MQKEWLTIVSLSSDFVEPHVYKLERNKPSQADNTTEHCFSLLPKMLTALVLKNCMWGLGNFKQKLLRNYSQRFTQRLTACFIENVSSGTCLLASQEKFALSSSFSIYRKRKIKLWRAMCGFEWWVTECRNWNQICGKENGFHAFLLQQWQDYQLKWDISDFGGINIIRVSPSKVWKPDIVLFNKWAWSCLSSWFFVVKNRISDSSALPLSRWFLS